ncbi:MAG: hypothetical protein M1838_003946 [Thelocarpon superellum]|nr:MAG: hypothetical protein M1838_003946 [Thelocarpon superellum]
MFSSSVRTILVAALCLLALPAQITALPVPEAAAAAVADVESRQFGGLPNFADGTEDFGSITPIDPGSGLFNAVEGLGGFP